MTLTGSPGFGVNSLRAAVVKYCLITEIAANHVGYLRTTDTTGYRQVRHPFEELAADIGIPISEVVQIIKGDMGIPISEGSTS